jgi:hypothetical protein
VLRKPGGEWGAYAYRLYLPGMEPLTRGIADIEGVLSDGRHFAIECKSRTGRLNDAQKIIADYSERAGLLYLVARDVDAVTGWLDEICKQ